jgi:polyphosphate kinase 2 (PPK2 family)
MDFVEFEKLEDLLIPEDVAYLTHLMTISSRNQEHRFDKGSKHLRSLKLS